MNVKSPTSDAPSQIPGRVRDNIFFPLLIACGGMFCLTTLVLLVCTFDTSGAPLVDFIEEHAPWMIFIEMGITIVVAILALAVDRRRTLAAMSSEAEANQDSVPAVARKDEN